MSFLNLNPTGVPRSNNLRGIINNTYYGTKQSSYDLIEKILNEMLINKKINILDLKECKDINKTTCEKLQNYINEKNIYNTLIENRNNAHIYSAIYQDMSNVLNNRPSSLDYSELVRDIPPPVPSRALKPGKKSAPRLNLSEFATAETQGPTTQNENMYEAVINNSAGYPGPPRQFKNENLTEGVNIRGRPQMPIPEGVQPYLGGPLQSGGSKRKTKNSKKSKKTKHNKKRKTTKRSRSKSSKKSKKRVQRGGVEIGGGWGNT